MATLSALVRGLDAELRRLGYKDATMVWYRRCWRRMQEHFAARGVEEFSLDAAMAWVDDACGFFGKEQAGTLKPNDIYLFRVGPDARRPRTTQLARQPVSPRCKEGLCAVLERQHRCHQGQQASTAHNPALLIRFIMFSCA